MAGKRGKDLWLERFDAGYEMVYSHPVFSPLLRHVRVQHTLEYIQKTQHMAIALNDGYIHINRKKRLEPEEWAYVLGHCLLHYGFWHFEDKSDPVRWNVACDMVITQFLKDIKVFKAPECINTDLPYPAHSEQELFKRLLKTELLPIHQGFSTCSGFTDMEESSQRSYGIRATPQERKETYTKLFEAALLNSVTAAVGVAAGYLESIRDNALESLSPAEKARRWFINAYPLLGALAATFKIVEDSSVCMREEIGVAAISESLQTIYINPGCGLTTEELQFVMAHELLHVGLRHGMRCQGRDPYLWNVACDFIINGWLAEMGVGQLPHLNTLYDREFSGMSAEEVYDIIVKDIRKFKKLATLRGTGLGDILGGEEGRFYSAPVDLDEFYRRAITDGLEYHRGNRGLIPAGLEEDIRALYQPPIAWDVKLARWFDRFFAPVERKRTYARPSRRQSSTPDIIRPRTIPDPEALEGRTFGVVIDTSGSMDQYLLAVALGAIASYADSRDVPYVRVIFCDAVAHDAGYMPPEAIGGRVTVRGREGTVLQPGINFLEKATDFPPNGPVLIITDAYCDTFRCRREHAILIPKGARLPFKATGEVFFFE